MWLIYSPFSFSYTPLPSSFFLLLLQIHYITSHLYIQNRRYFLQHYKKLLLAFLYPSVLLSSWPQRTTGVSMGGISWNMTRTECTLHEDLLIFTIESRWILHIMRNISDRSSIEINADILCSKHYSENSAVHEAMWTNLVKPYMQQKTI